LKDAKVNKLLVALFVFGLTCQSTFAWYSADFDESGLDKVSYCAGVYRILQDGNVMYVGRSRANIATRLRKHFKGTGSRCIDSARASNPNKWMIQWECSASHEQFEAQLIKDNSPVCNLRNERDPADD
jgi:hypothetical protein